MDTGEKCFLHLKIMELLKLELDLIDKFRKVPILGAFVRKTMASFAVVITNLSTNLSMFLLPPT